MTDFIPDAHTLLIVVHIVDGERFAPKTAHIHEEEE
jgi:hypothetical protein